MSDETAILVGIVVYVVVVAWLSRHIALDMDDHGKAGWAYGMMTFLLPPLGVALWLLDRDRPPTHDVRRPELGTRADAVFFLLLIVTFPWGLLIWLLLNRRAGT